MIFLGCLFDRSEESNLLAKSKRGLPNAVNTYQWNLIDGLNCVSEKPVDIINVLPVGTFPDRYKSLVLRSRNWSYMGSKNTEIGSINLPFIKQFSRARKTTKKIKEYNDKSIIIYSAYLPFLKAVFKLDSIYKITLVVTDLPEYYDFVKRSIIHNLLRKINNRLVYRYLKRIDAFVLLTEQMKYPLSVGNRPYVIVEGIAADNERGCTNTYGEGKKIILYTGSLNSQSGIRDLLDAFNLIDDAEYELWIAGSGEGEDEIKRRAEADSRIKYFGFVIKDQVYKLQSQATVLINPRKNEGEYTKYSFPSKTIEYMASGVPVLMYRLDGIPDEYDEYLTYIKGSSAESMAESITELCGKDIDELRQLGEKAKRFVLANKNPGKSAEKILNLIRDMSSENQ